MLTPFTEADADHSRKDGDHVQSGPGQFGGGEHETAAENGRHNENDAAEDNPPTHSLLPIVEIRNWSTFFVFHGGASRIAPSCPRFRTTRNHVAGSTRGLTSRDTSLMTMRA